ncbi:MAG TPA: sugar phosphate isomerase/epimerase family protein [Bryobacteraceae bacterium]|nr:sugar phosphate isomerase/epimerase family protein [Bryobacteraceae bacterium]
MKRRSFLQSLAAALPALPALAQNKRFRTSLAEWSIHRAIGSRMIDNLDFPRIAREQFGIEGLEFVNGLWAAPTQEYVAQLKKRMADTGTKGVLIMCDGEGLMGHSDRAVRMKAATNHRKWVDIAAELGCHSIRTNMHSDLKPSGNAEIEKVLDYCAESFNNICGYAAPAKINVIIENHGGISSDPDVVVRLMKKVNLPNFGTLPDFGNFPKEVDRYEAVKKLMPYAKGVSFKCYDFSPAGDETTIDVPKMMKVVNDAGYNSWVGIEYEGDRLSEFEGIAAGKRLLDRINA